MSGEKKIYRLTEVKEHKDSKSTWVVIDNSVYDITKFLEEVSVSKEEPNSACISYKSDTKSSIWT